MKQRRNRLCSMLLTFVLAVSSFGGSGVTLRAAAAEDEAESVVIEETDDDDEAAFEEEEPEVVIVEAAEDAAEDEADTEAETEEEEAAEEAEEAEEAIDEEPAEEAEPDEPETEAAEDADAAGETGGSCGASLTWSYDEGSKTLAIKGSGPMTDYSSTSAVPWHGYRSQIETVTIDDTVTSISAYAFQSFTAATGAFPVPASVTSIGKDAYSESKFTQATLTLPDSLTVLSEDAFEKCTGITKLVLPESLTEIGKYAFDGCSNLNDLSLPAGLTIIGSYAFRNCTALKSLTIPSKVTTINESAFYYCSGLQGDLELPASLITLGTSCFSGCSSYNGKLIIRSGALKKIPANAFSSCAFTSVSLPRGLKEIGGSAFSGNKMTAAVIPALVTTIGSNAFGSTANLTALYFRGNLPASLNTSADTLGKSTVKIYYLEGRTAWTASLNGHSCIASEEGDFPADENSSEELPEIAPESGTAGSLSYTISGTLAGETLTITGSGAMGDFNSTDTVPWYGHRESIVKVVISDGATTIGKNAFKDLNCVYGDFPIPAGVTSIGDYAFSGTDFSAASLELPAKLTVLGANSFEKCRGIEKLTIPAKVNAIGKDAFSFCENLTELVIIDGAGAVGEDAFEKCTRLRKAVIPGSVTTIGKYAFDGCTVLSELTLGDDIVDIQSYAFRNCEGLMEIELPKELLTIGESAFYYCKNLSGSLTLPAGLETIGSSAFSGCGYTGTLNMNCKNLTQISSNAFSGCKFNKLILPPKLTKIAGSAFNAVTAKQVIFPATLTSMGSSVFADASYLRNVYFRGDAPADKDMSSSSSKFLGDATKVTVYYISGKENWADTKWGYTCVGISESEFPEEEIPDDTVAVTGVTLSPESVSINKGQTAALTAAVSPSDASEKGVTWSSDKESVATVSTTGVVTGVASGNAIITVTTKDGGFTATCAVTVIDTGSEEPEPVSVNGVTIAPDEMELQVGMSGMISVTVSPSNADNKGYTLTSDDPAIAEVSDAGLVTGVASGNTVIRATTLDGGFTASCSVNVIPKQETDPEEDDRDAFIVVFFAEDELIGEDVVLEGETVTNLPVMDAFADTFVCWEDDVTGKTWNPSSPVFRNMKLSARFLADVDEPEESGRDKQPRIITIAEEEHVYLVKGQSYAFDAKDANNTVLNWKSTDASIVKISGKFKAKAVNITDVKKELEGDTGVYVYVGNSKDDYSRRYTVHIIDPVLKLVNGDKTEDVPRKLTLMPGVRQELALVVNGVEAWESDYAVSWTTSNEEVAKVDDGEIYTLAKGTAKITAYVNGKAYVCNIKVVDTVAPGKLGNDADVNLAALQTVSVKFTDSSFRMKDLVWSNADDDMGTSSRNGKVQFYQDNVVRVTPNGKLTAVGVGTTTLTAANAAGVKKSFTVQVNRPATTILYINKGKTKALKFYNVKNAKVAWDLDEGEDVIKLDKTKGKVTGLQTGIARVSGIYAPYAFTDDKGRTWPSAINYTATVYVEEPRLSASGGVSGINAAGTAGSLSLSREGTALIKLDGVYQPVVFESSKQTVVYVDEAGVVCARGAGSARLSARVNGRKFVVTVTVN